jgi:hypothetical protein
MEPVNTTIQPTQNTVSSAQVMQFIWKSYTSWINYAHGFYSVFRDILRITESSGLFAVCKSKIDNYFEGYHITERLDTYSIEFKGTSRLYKVFEINRGELFNHAAFNNILGETYRSIGDPVIELIAGRMRRPILHTPQAERIYDGLTRTFLQGKIRIIPNVISKKFTIYIMRS